jgi:hypothetical protein
MRGIYRQHGDLISLLLFFKNKGSGLKMNVELGRYTRKRL